MLYSRKGCDDTLWTSCDIRRRRPQGYVRFEMTHRWVRNLAILHGHIEVDTDEDLLVLEVEVGDCELLRERHGWR